MKLLSIAILVFPGLLHGSRSAAEQSPAPQIVVLASGLQKPGSLTVQPGSADLFFHEAGTGSILRLKAPFSGAAELAKPQRSIQLQAPGAQARGVSIEFLDHDHLLVGAVVGERPEVQVFRLDRSGQSGPEPLQSVQLQDSAVAEAGQPRGVLTTSKSAVLVVGGTVVEGGTAFTSELDRTKLAELQQLIPTKNLKSKAMQPAPVMGQPLAATLSPRGELVIVHRPQDSNAARLAFFNSLTGKLLLDQPLGSLDVSSIAYSAKTGRLYVTVSEDADAGGGIYRLDAALDGLKPAVRTIRLVDLDGPTSLACWPNGTAFVTIDGIAPEGASGAAGAKAGQLLSIDGGF